MALEQYNGIGKDSLDLASTVVGRGMVVCDTMEGLLARACATADEIAKLSSSLKRTTMERQGSSKAGGIGGSAEKAGKAASGDKVAMLRSKSYRTAATPKAPQ